MFNFKKKNVDKIKVNAFVEWFFQVKKEYEKA